MHLRYYGEPNVCSQRDIFVYISRILHFRLCLLKLVTPSFAQQTAVFYNGLRDHEARRSIRVSHDFAFILENR